MSKELEDYVSFIQKHHLPKITKYFVKKAEAAGFITPTSESKEKNNLTVEFRQLLKKIQRNVLLERSSDEIEKIKTELKDATLNESQLLSKYLLFLKNNKNALIHFIPLYSNNLSASVELMEEIENLFAKLEIEVIEQLDISKKKSADAPEEQDFLNRTQKKLKKATIELQLSQDQLLETQEIANVGSFIWDLESNEITASDELYRIYHADPGTDVKLTQFESFLDDEAKRKFRTNLKTALSEPKVFESEYKITLPGNEEKYINIRSKSIQNNEGRTIQIIGVIMDITSIKKTQLELNKKNKEINEANTKLRKTQKELERSNKRLDEKIKQRTQELKENNERYLNFIKLSSEGIWRYGLKNIDYIDTTLPQKEQVKLLFSHAYFAECNDKMAKLHGHKSAEDLTGKLFSDSKATKYSEEEKKKILEKFVHSGYRITNYETKDKDLNGEERYLQGSLFGIVEDKKLLSAWGIQRDITEKTKAEKSLKESEKRYRFLAENLPIIFWTATPEGYLDYGNQNWFDYTGSKKEQYKKIDWRNFVHPDDLKKTEQVWKESISSGKEYQTEYRLKDAKGNYRWHLGRSYPLKNNYGTIIKWMGTSIDINDQKTYADKLNNKNKELGKINNELDNLIYTVSHDLKAPVANIEGLVTALNDTLPNDCKDDEGVLGIMKMITDSVYKFKSNLMEVIDLAKAQKRGEETAIKNNLEEIIEEVTPDLKVLLQDKDVKIETDFKQCKHIYFNKKNLRSILYNLISNAIKYSSPDRTPVIKISTQKEEEHNILIVEDNGLGFDHQHINELTSKRLFKEIEGSGVGLYILKRIIDNADGKIEIDSKRGVGSKFTIYFPIKETDESSH